MNKDSGQGQCVDLSITVKFGIYWNFGLTMFLIIVNKFKRYLQICSDSLKGKLDCLWEDFSRCYSLLQDKQR